MPFLTPNQQRQSTEGMGMTVEIDVTAVFNEILSVTRQTERLQVDCSGVMIQQ